MGSPSTMRVVWAGNFWRKAPAVRARKVSGAARENSGKARTRSRSAVLIGIGGSLRPSF